MTPADAHRLLAPLYARHPEGLIAFGGVRDGAGVLQDFAILYANPAAARALGHADGALEGQRLLQQDLPCSREHFTRYREVVERGEPARCELLLPLPEGERWFGALAVPWADGLTVTLTDLSARKHLEAEREAARDRERHALTHLETLLAGQVRARADAEALARELEQGREHFRALTEAVPQVVWTAGPDGGIEHYNSHWSGYTAQVREQSLGWGWAETLHPEDAPAFLARWRQAVRETDRFEAEARFRQASDGAYRWHLSRARAQRDAQGRVVRWVGTLTDVHEQRELLEQQRLLTAIIEQSEDYIGIADLQGRTRYLNPAGVALVGHRSAQEAEGFPVLERVHPSQRAFVTEQVLPTVAREGRWLGEVLLRDLRTGEPLPVHYTLFNVHDPRTGALLGRATVTRDLRAERRLQAGHAAAEQRFRATFEQAAVGMMHVAWEGPVLRVNQRMCDFLGYTREELSQLSFQQLTHPEDLGKALRLHEDLMSGRGDSYALEKRYLRKDGSALWINLTLTLMRGPDGAPDYFICVVEDIGARRALEAERDQLLEREHAQRLKAEHLVEKRSRELAAAQAQLAQAEKLAMAGQLAAGVAHEVNNPLSYILSNLGFMCEDLTELSRSLGGHRLDELLQSAAEAREGAERIRTIVRDLKAFARPGTEVLQLVPLREAVEFAAGMAAHALHPRAQLLLDCPPELAVLGHKTKLGQLLLNLLLNAAQAIPEGGPAAHQVRVTARCREPGLACVEVQDTGRGIAPEHLSRIFEPFFTTRPVGEGSGLGLSVCHGIVQAMGGRIEVESTLGEGSTLRVLLPLAPQRAQAAPAAQELPEGQLTFGTLAGAPRA